MTTERDAKADLVVCEAAAPGPWTPVRIWNKIELYPPDLPDGPYGPRFPGSVCMNLHAENAAFIVLAREAMVYWIERAVKAEAQLAALKGEATP